LSGGSLRQIGVLSTAAARNRYRKTIGLSKMSAERVLHHKIVERRAILSFFVDLWRKSVLSRVNKSDFFNLNRRVK
jgi:hypothetical protein